MYFDFIKLISLATYYIYYILQTNDVDRFYKTELAKRDRLIADLTRLVVNIYPKFPYILSWFSYFIYL